MSLLTNRKRPRGYSENFAPSQTAALNSSYQSQQQQQQQQQSQQQQEQHHQQQMFLQHQGHQGHQYNPAQFTQSGHHDQMDVFDGTSSSSFAQNSNFGYNNSATGFSPHLQPKKSKFSNPFLSAEENDDILDDGENNTFVLDDVDERDGDARGGDHAITGEEEEDDEYDDDIIIIDEKDVVPRGRRNNSDSILINPDAQEAYNLFNVNQFEIDKSTRVKKQRTSSLPQLPQVKCFYDKLPNNYILQTPKLGNIKANVIPHQNNLPPCDDENGHYIIRINDSFANRFVIVKLLGQGTFGKVVQCFDKVNREQVAIKIIRNIQKYRDAAKIELRILSTLKKFDNANKNHCIHLRECFDYRGHICIVTDLLKISLYDFLENNKFISFPGSHIQAISKQLIRSVTFLHDLNLIHTDLKPENILLHDDSFTKKQLYSSTIKSAYLNLGAASSPKSNTKRVPKTSKVLKNPLIQVIDFGSAIFDDEYHSSIVSTRHYRAPEIVLGTGWSFPCDMWSIGCILVELIIGEPLFKTHDNLEHLAMIERIAGYRIDKEMVKLSKLNENECGLEYFTNEYVGDLLDGNLLHNSAQDSPSGSTSISSCSDDDDDDEEEVVRNVGAVGLDSDVDYDLTRRRRRNAHHQMNEPNESDEDDDDDVIFDEEKTIANSLVLKFPTESTPQKFINAVDELSRIDLFISSRIGLRINFDYSLNQNYEENKSLINFGNFTFWWFFIDLLKKMFVINPRDRITALEALNHPWFNLGIQDEGTV
ncbi:LKH1 [Candida metapsilosis]|uniref:LKH1 n=1 Tax=Candida metapsilosis TaxID=273372 RepID=A0A8H7ZF15_9ASCO|nr:LKH1 [Candida metapsilosis]